MRVKEVRFPQGFVTSSRLRNGDIKTIGVALSELEGEAVYIYAITSRNEFASGHIKLPADAGTLQAAADFFQSAADRATAVESEKNRP